MITTTLLEAYKATCYEIIQPKIAIFIGQENETLQIFLKENDEYTHNRFAIKCQLK